MMPATNTQARIVPRVLQGRCQSCRKCLARQSCKTKALLQVDAGEAPFVDVARCYGCHACVLACPWGAIAIGE